MRLGFAIAPQTEQYIRYAINSGVYDRIAGDRKAPALQTRLKNELKYILQAPYWKAALQLLADLGALKCIHPTLELDRQLWHQLRLLERCLDRSRGESGESGSEEEKPPTGSILANRFTNPIELLQWQQNLEEAIAHTLKTLSLETNRLLQQAGILPQKLPSPLLEAATTASESSAEITVGPPNVMNLLIETENSTEAENSSMMQLIAIQLRLSEIEFTDANVRAARNQIRQLETRINQLGQEYQKKQRERIIAEAEAAWRCSWFED